MWWFEGFVDCSGSKHTSAAIYRRNLECIKLYARLADCGRKHLKILEAIGTSSTSSLGKDAARGYIVVSCFYTARAGVALYCFKRGGRRFSGTCVHPHDARISHNNCSVAPHCNLCRQLLCLSHRLQWRARPPYRRHLACAGLFLVRMNSTNCKSDSLHVKACEMCQHVYIAENKPPAQC